MKKESENIAPKKEETLPEFHLVRKYPKENWLCIGDLTFAVPPSPKTQLLLFRKMMHLLGWKNRAFGRRLHWVVRVGGDGKEVHHHLHFLLGFHQLTNGHRYRYRPEEVRNFILRYWKKHHGEWRKVKLFDSSRGGISYVLRREGNDHAFVEMSEGLLSVIKKIQRTEIPQRSEEIERAAA